MKGVNISGEAEQAEVQVPPMGGKEGERLSWILLRASDEIAP